MMYVKNLDYFRISTNHSFVISNWFIQDHTAKLQHNEDSNTSLLCLN